jgi:hypothetical protein
MEVYISHGYDVSQESSFTRGMLKNFVVRLPQISIVELQMDLCGVKIAITKEQLQSQKIHVVLSQGSGGK